MQHDDSLLEEDISLSIASQEERAELVKRANKEHFIEHEIMQTNSLTPEDRDLLLQAMYAGIEGDFEDDGE